MAQNGENEYIEDYVIASMGPVNAGKSTWTNCILSQNVTPTHIQITTLNPQKYIICREGDTPEEPASIKYENELSNQMVRESQWDGEKTNQYNVEMPKDFIKQHPNLKYHFWDLPGLNDGATGDNYANWVRRQFHSFDLIVLVSDINSGLGSTDEKTIINLIFQGMKEFPHTQLIILLNKCDEMIYDERTRTHKFETEELSNIYENQIKPNINSFAESFGIDQNRIHLLPICALNIFIFRHIFHNTREMVEREMDSRYLNRMVREELGTRRWQQMGPEEQNNAITNVIETLRTETEPYENSMKHTGYREVQKTLERIVNNDHRDFFHYRMKCWLEKNPTLKEIIDRSIAINKSDLGEETKAALIELLRDHLIQGIPRIAVGDEWNNLSSGDEDDERERLEEDDKIRLTIDFRNTIFKHRKYAKIADMVNALAAFASFDNEQVKVPLLLYKSVSQCMLEHMKKFFLRQTFCAELPPAVFQNTCDSIKEIVMKHNENCVFFQEFFQQYVKQAKIWNEYDFLNWLNEFARNLFSLKKVWLTILETHLPKVTELMFQSSGKKVLYYTYSIWRYSLTKEMDVEMHKIAFWLHELQRKYENQIAQPCTWGEIAELDLNQKFEKRLIDLIAGF